MASDTARLKSRNRRFIAELKRPVSAVPRCHPSTPMLNLHQNFETSTFQTGKPSLLPFSHPQNEKSSSASSRFSLSSCYRPAVLQKSGTSRIRRRVTDTATINARSRKSASPGSSQPSAAVVSSSHLAQLADRVHSLALQEITSDSSGVEESRPIVDKQLSPRISSPCSITGALDAPKSPWYRHCRPCAPEPHCSPERISIECYADDGSMMKIKSFNSEERQEYPDSSFPTGPQDDGISHHVARRELGPGHHIPTPLLELDVDQENWCCSDFLLPPPPARISSESRSPELTFERFPTPPSFLYEMSSETGIAQDSTRRSAFNLGPLAPITNILSTYGLWGVRLPKWATDPELLTMDGSQRLQHSESDPEFAVHLTPSPPPQIVERMPLPRSPVRLTVAQFSPTDTSPFILAKPTVLKRGAPDGAEHKPVDSETTKPMADTLGHSTGKRMPNDEVPTVDYSPKKSRPYLLLPSEHSAFLPVVSSQSHRCPPVQSSCSH